MRGVDRQLGVVVGRCHLDDVDAGLVAAGRPGVVTYSPKVFIPVTKLCRDRCHYCTFVTVPGRLRAAGKGMFMEADEILEVARQYGADTVARPDDLATDIMTLDPAVHHAVVEMERRGACSPSLVATLQPTSPLLSVESIDRTIAHLKTRDDVDTARPHGAV